MIISMESVSSGVQTVEIGGEQAGQRIDNFLIRILKGVPKSRIYRMMRRGEVRVNSGRIRPTYRLAEGDSVRIPPVRTAQRTPVLKGSESFAWLESRIIYEDNRMLVLNKPTGMAVHGGSGVSFGVIEAMRMLRPKAPFLELVHRLDRDTSGCLMLAKRRSQLRSIHELLRTGEVEKRYRALVKGQWTGGSRSVNEPLRKSQIQSGERMVFVDPEGKEARTRFNVITVFKNATLMDVELDTGRTHQIRVHASHIDHPIAGDEKYGDREFNRQMRGCGVKRLFLHSSSLAFKEPYSGQPITIEAPLDDDLQQVLKHLD